MSERERDRRADAEARRAAQRDVASAMVLEAGAGTGKTTVLITRVLAWCLDQGWARAAARLARASAEPAGDERVAEEVLARVVAITFTEAAAAEMESRAIGAFRAVADGAPVLGFDPTLVGVDAPTQRLRARALFTASDQLRFQTIHAFCRRTLAAHALAAGLHPRFTVDASGAERAAAVRETLEAWLRDVADTGDADLEALLLDGLGAPELERVLLALAGAGVRARDFAADPLAPERVARWARGLREAAEAFADAEGGRFATARRIKVGVEIADAAARTEALLRGLPAEPDALEPLVADLQSLWPANRAKKLREYAAGEFGETERAALGADREPFVAAAARSLHMQIVALATLAPASLTRVHRVVARLFERVEARLAERGSECFDALLSRTRDLFAARPDVAALVRSEIDQLLVDEFQDTDRVQCDVVAALALDGDPAARPVLFVVGDPKQSIYGWRNADLGAYLRFVERVVAAGAPKHVLSVSFRSVPAVLDEVERIVAPSMTPEPGVQAPFQRLLPTSENERVPGSGIEAVAAVEYWCSDAWDESTGAFAAGRAHEAVVREAHAVAADLLQLHAHAAWSDVAILLRATGDVDVYLGALREAGIPYRVDRDRDFHQRREIRDATALACAVLDPSDQISLVATLRSAWVGVPDAAWRPLWDRHFPDVARAAIEGRADALEGARRIADVVAGEIAAVRGVAALAGWERSLVHALEMLAALRDTWANGTSDDFVEALRARTLFEATEAARHPGAFRVANLARFFRELAAALESQAGDVAGVVRALRDVESSRTEVYQGRAAAPGEDAVTVTTIHGAKGLDWRHVYLVQTHKGSSPPKQAFAHESLDAAIEWRLAVGGVSVSTFGWSEVAARRERVEAAERVRTLYVAATRAKRRLVITGRLEHPGGRADRTHARMVRDAIGPALAVAREAMLASETGRAELARAPHAADAAAPPSVRWIARGPEPVLARLAAAARPALATDAVEAEAERLDALDEIARARGERRLVGRASEQAADARREVASERAEWEGEGRARVDAEREVAAAVGTAVHALLERLDWGAPDRDVAWSAQIANARASLDRVVSPSLRETARTRADAILEALRRGPLFALLERHAAHSIARELTFVMPSAASETGAVSAWVGAIDWIYWDAEDGCVVVVDFKTDRVESDADLGARVAHHRPQAERYALAVRQALALESLPRVELWFLAAGRRAVVEIESG